MRRSDAIVHWLAALIISSAAVAASVFILEIATAPSSSVLVELAIIEAHVEHQPSVSDLSAKELAQKIGSAFAAFVIITTPIIILFALVPALLFSSILESPKNFPSILVYAAGGLMTGLAFSFFALSPLEPLGHGFFTDSRLDPLRFIFLGAAAGFIGGWVLGWRRRSYFRLFLQRRTN